MGELKLITLDYLDLDIDKSENILTANKEIAESLMNQAKIFEKELDENSRPSAFVGHPIVLKK